MKYLITNKSEHRFTRKIIFRDTKIILLNNKKAINCVLAFDRLLSQNSIQTNQLLKSRGPHFFQSYLVPSFGSYTNSSASLSTDSIKTATEVG